MNLATQDLMKKLYRLKCDPMEGMVKIAQDEKNPTELRAKMFAEISQYIYPKRKAVEMSVDPASPPSWDIRITGVAPAKPTGKP